MSHLNSPNNNEIIRQAKLYEKKEEFHKAFELYEKIGDSIEGLSGIRELFNKGCYDIENNDKIFKLYNKLYDLTKDPDILVDIGWCYQYGIGIERNINIANKFYKEAADANSIKGLFKFADQYMKTNNDDKAIEFYKKIQKFTPNNENKKEIIAASLNLLIFYNSKRMQDSKDTKVEITNIVHKLTEIYDPSSFDRLYKYYLDDIYVPKDLLFAAKLKYEGIQFNYVKKTKREKFIEMIKILKESCSFEELIKLAQQKEGEMRFEEAFEIYSILVDGNNKENDIKALYLLRSIIKGKYFIICDNNLVFKSITNLYNLTKDPDVLVDVGLCYSCGTGVKKNRKEAFDMYRNAASMGSLIGLYYSIFDFPDEILDYSEISYDKAQEIILKLKKICSASDSKKEGNKIEMCPQYIILRAFKILINLYKYYNTNENIKNKQEITATLAQLTKINHSDSSMFEFVANFYEEGKFIPKDNDYAKELRKNAEKCKKKIRVISCFDNRGKRWNQDDSCSIGPIDTTTSCNW